MTDRHAAYLVVLDHDIREDDAEEVLTALRMVKGVASVRPVIANTAQAIAAGRRDIEWTTALHDLARRGPGGAL